MTVFQPSPWLWRILPISSELDEFAVKLQTHTSMSAKWFNVQVVDYERAKVFYSKVFKSELREERFLGAQIAFLPRRNGQLSGAIWSGDSRSPLSGLDLAYLNIGGVDDIDTILERVIESGGNVLMRKVHINDEVGSVAVFVDSEGNRVGIHSTI